MAQKQGDPVWYELTTPDTDASAAFYAAVIGWTAQPADAGMAGYRVLRFGQDEVGGLFPATDGMPVQWLAYFAVEDVDTVASRAVSAGGRQYVPPTDIPGIGRFAVLGDPQGVAFAVMRGMDGGESRAFQDCAAGHCQWNELATTDQAAAFAFFGRLFGWEKGDAMQMGDEGEYRFISHAGKTIGAMMTRKATDPPPGWTFYFGVPDIEVAHKAIMANGGTVHLPPSPIPGGGQIVVAADPQGAGFGLVAPGPG